MSASQRVIVNTGWPMRRYPCYLFFMRSCVALLFVFSTGCGLILDLDPPDVIRDGGVDATVSDGELADARDQGRGDGGGDAGDQGLRDSGDDMGDAACTAPADCPACFDCMEGTCLPAPSSLTATTVAGAVTLSYCSHPTAGNGVVEFDGDRSCAEDPLGVGCHTPICGLGACSTCALPSREICNGVDDDCDGELDEVESCREGTEMPRCDRTIESQSGLDDLMHGGDLVAGLRICLLGGCGPTDALVWELDGSALPNDLVFAGGYRRNGSEGAVLCDRSARPSPLLRIVDGPEDEHRLIVRGALRFENVAIEGSFDVRSTGDLTLSRVRLTQQPGDTPDALISVDGGTLLVDGAAVEYSTSGRATIWVVNADATIRDSHIVRRGSGYAMWSERTTLKLHGNCHSISSSGQCEPPALLGGVLPEHAGIFADNATPLRVDGGVAEIHTNMFINLADPSRAPHTTVELSRTEAILANNWIGGARAEIAVHSTDSNIYSKNNIVVAAPNTRALAYGIVRGVFVEGGTWAFDGDQIGVGYAGDNRRVGETRGVDCEGHCSFRGGAYGGALKPVAPLAFLQGVLPEATTAIRCTDCDWLSDVIVLGGELNPAGSTTAVGLDLVGPTHTTIWRSSIGGGVASRAIGLRTGGGQMVINDSLVGGGVAADARGASGTATFQVRGSTFVGFVPLQPSLLGGVCTAAQFGEGSTVVSSLFIGGCSSGTGLLVEPLIVLDAGFTAYTRAHPGLSNSPPFVLGLLDIPSFPDVFIDGDYRPAAGSPFAVLGGLIASDFDICGEPRTGEVLGALEVIVGDRCL